MKRKNTDPPARPAWDMTVTHAAEHGTRRDLLMALRRVLADALEDDRTQPRDLSPITMRLREISSEIEDLDVRESHETPDEPFGGFGEPFSADDL